ncbi:AGL001Wp [Eremothecium gossypii ATCC 10895]|uniref:Histone acetyltransferase type B catalytic subunit n=1 Tax=Eremothecium gossypii (strain ATCC 10895 / CBS 109.51 / FGSC 9923 / NRRL Y-1056) TaxID=284811 RepID=HAT1_EREGS|nr:AGL001Wp [Eremothecium gossypii ATCC 10895]Q750F5.2 RecName: Full=Histone acetyltransferase type B catalytic subunit [Eremothecium gossypii ATCC 10895]AAS54489.2 AGL001Wp [Eremothecium gossypii ATCC 10895]AEY98821.1 FAGL001Wp [Eremothecium gossypii FDAG1]
MAEELKPELWTTSSNSALKLSLVNDENAVQFSPIFTYPIFGQAEQLFGYQDLNILLAFDSVTFKPFLNIKYTKKLERGLDDVEGSILKFLPEGDVILKDEVEWVDAFNGEREKFALPNSESKVAEYTSGGESFAIFKVHLSDPNIRQLHRRMQIFTLLFIEAASYIDEDDSAWDIFMTFNTSTRQCIGYTTTYKHWRYINGQEFDSSEKTTKRAKISQFIIFPPYQSKSHGSHLYSAAIDVWSKEEKISEVTVEDPNEAFDDLRDRCDFMRLSGSGLSSSIPEDVPIPRTWLTEQARKYKLSLVQFTRLVEMILLYDNSPNFEIQVKARLYQKNHEVLTGMDSDTRKAKLQEAFTSLKEDYARILQKVPNRRRVLPSDEENAGESKRHKKE